MTAFANDPAGCRLCTRQGHRAKRSPTAMEARSICPSHAHGRDHRVIDFELASRIHTAGGLCSGLRKAATAPRNLTGVLRSLRRVQMQCHFAAAFGKCLCRQWSVEALLTLLSNRQRCCTALRPALQAQLCTAIAVPAHQHAAVQVFRWRALCHRLIWSISELVHPYACIMYRLRSGSTCKSASAALCLARWAPARASF